MKCLNPSRVHGDEYNCGHCRNCRINYTSQWTLRLMYELDSWDEAAFITLTYDDAHLPSMSLNKEELQKFNKRLRAVMKRRFDQDIKFYSIGEYGSRTKRPHFHGIYFGINPYNEEHRQAVKDCWLPRCEEWQFDRSRGKKSAIALCEHDSIQYVTGYVQKKLYGKLALKEYKETGRIPPFSLCSQGLGLDFALKNADRLRSNGFTYIQGQKIGLPKYLREKLGISVQDYIQEVPEFRRKKFIEESKKLQDLFFEQNPDVDFSIQNLEALASRYERWYEKRRWSIADRIMLDFQQRCKLKGGIV